MNEALPLLELAQQLQTRSVPGADEQYLPIRKVRQRYDTSDETIRRWLQDESSGFPKPIYFSKRRYWRLSELVQWERHLAELRAGEEK